MSDDPKFTWNFRALMGHTEPKDTEAIKCPDCDWTGTIAECHRRHFSSGGDSWQHLDGRRGYHWHCPNCNEVVWAYYHTVS